MSSDRDERNVDNYNEKSSLIKNTVYNKTTLKKRSINSNNSEHQAQNQNESEYLDHLLTAISDRRSKCHQNASFIIILTVHTLERFAFYGLVCNYILYLNKEPLKWESYNASLMLYILFGLTNITSLFGGWIADSRIGKFNTIAISYFIYIVGYAAFPFLSMNSKRLPGLCFVSNSNTTVDWSNLTRFYDYEQSNLKKFDRSIASESCSWIIIVSVVFIGIGVGFIRANLGPFGADQVKF
jgi:dipeptide/tripeptide permease